MQNTSSKSRISREKTYKTLKETQEKLIGRKDTKEKKKEKPRTIKKIQSNYALIQVPKPKLRKGIRFDDIPKVSHEDKAPNKNKKEKALRHHNRNPLKNAIPNYFLFFLLQPL
jgi:hypothetical protein